MEKRSFNILCTVVLASMAIIGTYKITKKKSHQTSAPVAVNVASKVNK